MKHIKVCRNCNAYTMKETCTKCGEKTSSPKPPKYSPEDKYAKYRREAKLQERKSSGLL